MIGVLQRFKPKASNVAAALGVMLCASSASPHAQGSIPALKLVPELRIDSATDSAVLVSWITVSPTGVIVAANSQLRTLTFTAADGKQLGTFNGEAAGMSGFGVHFWIGDTLLVLDPDSKKYTRRPRPIAPRDGVGDGLGVVRPPLALVSLRSLELCIRRHSSLMGRFSRRVIQLTPRCRPGVPTRKVHARRSSGSRRSERRSASSRGCRRTPVSWITNSARSSVISRSRSVRCRFATAQATVGHWRSSTRSPRDPIPRSMR